MSNPHLDSITEGDRNGARFLSLALDIGHLAFMNDLRELVAATGVAKVAERSGLNRESLYKAIAPGAKPRFETVARILSALDLRFTVQPKA